MVTLKGYADPLSPHFGSIAAQSMVRYTGLDTSVGDHATRRADADDATYDGWTHVEGDVENVPKKQGNYEQSRPKAISFAEGIDSGTGVMTLFQMNANSNIVGASLKMRVKSAGGTVVSASSVQPLIVRFNLGRFTGTSAYFKDIFAGGTLTVFHDLFPGEQDYLAVMAEEVLAPLREALASATTQNGAVFAEYWVDASQAALTDGDTLPILISEISLLLDINSRITLPPIRATSFPGETFMIGPFVSLTGVPSDSMIPSGETGPDGVSMIHQLRRTPDSFFNSNDTDIVLWNVPNEPAAGTPFSCDLLLRDVLLTGVSGSSLVGACRPARLYPGSPLTFTLRA